MNTAAWRVKFLLISSSLLMSGNIVSSADLIVANSDSSTSPLFAPGREIPKWVDIAYLDPAETKTRATIRELFKKQEIEVWIGGSRMWVVGVRHKDVEKATKILRELSKTMPGIEFDE